MRSNAHPRAPGLGSFQRRAAVLAWSKDVNVMILAVPTGARPLSDFAIANLIVVSS